MSELWDCYDKAFQKIEGKILVRGQEAIFSVDEYHLVCDVAVRHADGLICLCREIIEKRDIPVSGNLQPEDRHYKEKVLRNTRKENCWKKQGL